MTDHAAKSALYGEFAAVGKVLGNPKRLELLDLLAQAPRSVESLAVAAGLGVTTCSAHLQIMRNAGLVTGRREGKRIFYDLASDDVAAMWESLRRVTERHRPHLGPAGRAYLGPEDTDAVDTERLLSLADRGDVVLLDVRPAPEYEAGHLPDAVNIPLDELGDRIAELPDDREIVAYCRGRWCAFAHEAVRLLTDRGLRARRAQEGALEWRVAGRL